MLAIVGNAAIAVKRIIRIIAGIHHHHAHRNAPRPVGSLNRNRKRAWFERQRRRPGNGVHATGKLAVDVVLFVCENAALEIVVAVGCREGDSRFQCRSEECYERVSYFLPRAVEYGRSGRAIDGLRPRFKLVGRSVTPVAFVAFHEFRRVGADAVNHPIVVGRGLFEQRFGERMAFDSADFRFDFGDRAYVRARLLSAAAQERVDVRGVVSANLVAGEDDQIGMRFLDGGFDETDRVFAYIWSVLNIGHLQHTEGAVAVESQGHDAHCNAANLDMR